MISTFNVAFTDDVLTSVDERAESPCTACSSPRTHPARVQCYPPRRSAATTRVTHRALFPPAPFLRDERCSEAAEVRRCPRSDRRKARGGTAQVALEAVAAAPRM